MEKPILIKGLGSKYPSPNDISKRKYGLFKCQCGKTFQTQIYLVESNHTKSCGCHNIKMIVQRNTTHGLSNTRLHKIWTNMKTRCYNSKDRSYKWYGKRGITVCEEWKNDFLSFYKWALNNGYHEQLKIDRKNVNENYYPNNCRWVDNFVNAQNKQLVQVNNTSGYRGIVKHDNKWEAKIGWNNKRYYLGFYNTPKSAALAYNNFIIKHSLNYPLNIIT